MKRMRLIPLSAICAVIAATVIVTPRPESATKPIATPSPAIYNPYPSGILPADLTAEIARVQREVAFIENEALGQSHALASPTVTGQPPTLQNTGQRANVLLGKLMNFDVNALTSGEASYWSRDSPQ